MIDWIDAETFDFGGQRFQIEVGSELEHMRSSADCLVLGKARHMIERLVDQNAARDDVQRIVELGIFQGGSTALLYEVCRPDRIVAIDLMPDRVTPLETFISNRGLEDNVHLHYGVDQADRSALAKICDLEFGDAALDLVIDDASHAYGPTRSSFEVLFPRLREGGRYVIEDWDWAHYPGERWQKDGGLFAESPTLTNLVVEILMVAGGGREIVSEVTIVTNVAEVVRGPAPLASPMELSSLYLNRGLPFRPLM